MNIFVLASKITAKDSWVNFNKQILIDIKQEMANIKSAFARLNVIRHFDSYHCNKKENWASNWNYNTKLQLKMQGRENFDIECYPISLWLINVSYLQFSSLIESK